MDTGFLVTLAATPSPEEIDSDPSVTFSLIGEETDFLVINKPSGITTHPKNFTEQGTFIQGVIARFPEIRSVGENLLRPGLVHRLDKDTSGLMVIARTNEGFHALKEAFKARTVRKEYAVLVWGVPRENEGTITTPLRRAGRVRMRWVADPKAQGGKTAITRYTLREAFDKAAFLRVQLATGRTHQIRVHFLSIGHPVVGERIYIPKRLKNENERFPRQMLHAEKLIFPYREKEYAYTAPLPVDFQNALHYFRTHSSPP